ncbi:scabin-related ADP-ribosyltransferase [Vibrio parahaemolyticus]|uniref:scabin-related ADP-ribosyltransferase n=1 Tax=Vibrio parahaemolyticus TaxID=670 RepID=UPI002362ECC9|nr:enterotoxin A family protein [Vibrio parahaemolyticus]
MKKIILLLIITSLSYKSYAISTVYRGDSREPADVFQNGFLAWGTNVNVNAHVLGLSGARGSRNSAFIPTTPVSSRARTFAIDLLNTSSNGMAYIYNIRPTHNFYNMITSMYHLYDSTGTLVPISVREMINIEREYAAYSNIPPQLIRSVTILTRLSNGDIREEVQANPNYTDDNTHANEEPFTNNQPSTVTVRPILLMGPSMTNINNELPNNSSRLPSPEFTYPMVLPISGSSSANI